MKSICIDSSYLRSNLIPSSYDGFLEFTGCPLSQASYWCCSCTTCLVYQRIKNFSCFFPTPCCCWRFQVDFMGDSRGKIKFIPDHFQVPTSVVDSLENRTPAITETGTDSSLRSWRHLWARRTLRAASMLRFFTFRGLPWGLSHGGQEKVELTAAEVESLRSELADIEEREAQLKAQLENIDEILRTARLSGYLYIRTRWTALPGEPPPIDDTEVDDWLPRFFVLHDLSPLDSTLLSDIVEVDRLPSFKCEDDEVRYAFYILTRRGLRYECSSNSKIKVDAWLSALRTDCKMEPDASAPNGSIKM